jgi:DMSO/TMAO reductase YedYZ heme-binding membrane subunit
MSRRAWRWLAGSAMAVLVATPIAVFLATTGAPWRFLESDVPPGQSAYIMMRPAGHLAFVMLFLQIVVGPNASKLGRVLGVPRMVELHRQLGVAAMVLVVTHPLLFAWGRSLRAEKLYLWATLTPRPFENYWELMCAVGVVSLYLLVVAVLAGIFGARRFGRSWRWLHACAYPAFFGAFVHAISIGAETRFWPVWLAYWAMAMVAGASLAWRAWRAARPRGSAMAAVSA